MLSFGLNTSIDSEKLGFTTRVSVLPIHFTPNAEATDTLANYIHSPLLLQTRSSSLAMLHVDRTRCRLYAPSLLHMGCSLSIPFGNKAYNLSVR